MIEHTVGKLFLSIRVYMYVWVHCAWGSTRVCWLGCLRSIYVILDLLHKTMFDKKILFFFSIRSLCVWLNRKYTHKMLVPEMSISEFPPEKVIFIYDCRHDLSIWDDRNERNGTKTPSICFLCVMETIICKFTSRGHVFVGISSPFDAIDIRHHKLRYFSKSFWEFCAHKCHCRPSSGASSRPNSNNVYRLPVQL